MFVEGVEFIRMGQNLTLARYPIHWHLVGEGQGQYIRNAAIHDTYNRCVTVHGTNNLQVENNVTFNTVGHCFFLEDGVETGNQFVHNLGIMTKCHTSKPCVPTNLAASGSPRVGGNGQQSKDVLIPSDNTVSTFWITNPDNVYRDNVAAGSDQIGFWFATPVHPTGAFEGSDVGAKIWPRRTPPREFKGNVAHSNFDSFMFDRNPAPNGTFSVAGGNAHTAKENPADNNSKTVESLIDSFTSYKNRNGGVWTRGEMKVFKNYKVADSAIGFTSASGSLGRDIFTSKVTESLFVGETENIGNPRTPEEIAYGRSLPKPEMPDFPIRGYEYYDLRHDVENVTFVNFQDNATRKTGAISYLMYTSFGVSNENSIEKAKFVNAKPVYFPPSTERKWASDTGGSGYNRAGFHDKDGSVGGVPDSYIMVNSGTAASAANENCRIEENWGARVCKGDYVRQNAGGGGRGGAGGGRGGAGGRGGGAPRGGAAGPGGAGGRGGAGGPGAPGGRGGAPRGGAPGGNN
jgi:cell migration-inducing and hyaluronan-binding protein